MTVKGKTQTDIINDLDINKSAISSWCNGTRLPRMNKVQLLADYFSINVSDLIEGSCDNNNYFEFISEDDSMFPLLDVGDIALIYKQNIIDKTDNKNKGTYLLKLNGKNTIRKLVLDENNNIYQLNRPRRSEKEKTRRQFVCGFFRRYTTKHFNYIQAASTKFGVTVMLSGKERLLSATTFPH